MRTPRRPLGFEVLEDRSTPAVVPDPTFGQGGEVSVPPSPAGVSYPPDGGQLLPLPDGRLMMRGVAAGKSFVTRLTPDGRADPTFNGGEYLWVTAGDDDPRPVAVFDLVAALAGAVVLTGVVGVGPGGISPGVPGNRPLFAARVGSDGTFDPGFGQGGRAVIDLDEAALDTEQSGVAAAVGPDGRVTVLATRTETYPYTCPGGDGVVCLAVVNQTRAHPPLVVRLTARGGLDPTFGEGGVFDLAPGWGERAFAPIDLAVTAGDRVVVAGGLTPPAGGGSPTHIGLIRLTPDGSPDSQFGLAGRAVVAFPRDVAGNDATARRVTRVEASGGGVVVASDLFSSDPEHSRGGFSAGVTRVTAGGELDPTFGVGGQATVIGSYVGLDVAPDGGVTVGTQTYRAKDFGLFPVPAEYALVLTRLTAAGNPDAGFDADGTAAFPISAPPSGGTVLSDAVARQDGRVVVAGTEYDNTLPESQGFVRQYAEDVPPLPIARAGPPSPPVRPLPGVARRLAVGGVADGSVRMFEPIDGARYAAAGTATVFPGRGSVRAVVADVNGDGTPDQVYGAGPGGGSKVRIVYAVPAGVAPVALPSPPVELEAFEPGYTGGVFVAAGDVDGDGRAEIVVSPDAGGGPRVRVFALTGDGPVERDNFFALDDPAFRGGVRPALGDVNGDGLADLVVAAGVGGGPRVAVFDGAGLLSGAAAPPRLVNDFFAFPGADAERLRNGVYVAAGDMTGDGKADLAFGGGPGGGPRVLALDGATVLADPAAAHAAPVANFFAGSDAARGGVSVAVKDPDADGRADLLAGSGAGESSRVRLYTTPTLRGDPTPVADQEFDPFGAVLADGVFVG